MKDLKFYKDNCEDNYLHTPISVLRYISELEKAIKVAYEEGFEKGALAAADDIMGSI